MLSVSRWYDPDSHRGEFYRLVAIAASALQRNGVPAAELKDHVIALNVGNIVTVITRPDAFTDCAMAGARDGGLRPRASRSCWGRTSPSTASRRNLMSGKADAAYFASLPENVTPSTDDNPFFFYTARFGDLVDRPACRRCTNNNTAITMTLAADRWWRWCACVYYIVVPFIRLARRMPLATLTPPVTYFCAIGMGFMLIEISQMQRLMVFLGHPVYGLSVVLFTILLFGGSAAPRSARGRPASRGHRQVGRAARHARDGGTADARRSRHGRARKRPTCASCCRSLLLAPPAFCMGMMFPLGLSIWRRQTELLPYFWSANGITSMFASVLGMALSIEFGIANTYALGVCFYVVCAAMLVASRQTSRSGVPGLVRQGGSRRRARFRCTVKLIDVVDHDFT